MIKNTKYILSLYNKEYKVHIKKGFYTSNGNLAIQLLEIYTDISFATLTVNLEEKLPHDLAYLDTNNCPWAVDFVRDNNLGQFTGIYGQSGFCRYPLYRFYEEE